MKRRPDYQLRQELLHSFRKSTKNYAEFANSMKNSSDRGEVSSVLLQLFRTLPAYERLIFGNVFPKTIEQLGLGTTHFYIPESLENELYWLLIPIRHHKTQMLEFLSMTDFMSRTEIDPLLQVIMKSSVSSHVFMTSDIELNIVLKTIYEIVKE